LPAPTGGSGGLMPQEIVRETDVLPGKRRGMREQRLRHGLSTISWMRNGVGDVCRVPIDDRSDDQVEA
jgi:hypothetical protein